MTKNKLRLLAIQHRKSSVGKYRIEPLVDLLGAKIKKEILRKNDKATIETLAKRFKKVGDVWVIKYIDDMHTLDVLHTMKKVAGAKIIVDIDDLMWCIPTGNIAKGSVNQFVNRGIALTQSVQAADYITVSTEPLKNAINGINSNVEVLPNFIKPEEWKFKRKKHKKTRIGWVWSPTHIPDMHVVEDALREISKRDDVEIVIFGTELDIFKDIKTTNIKGVVYTDYPKVFTEAGIDISIAPLEDNDFNRCKSNIKWLESTMAGAAFIGSNVYPYEFSVKDGKTGYLAKNTSQWVKKMTNLIENPEKRAEMVKNARKEVLEKYANGNKHIEFYEKLAKQIKMENNG